MLNNALVLTLALCTTQPLGERDGKRSVHSSLEAPFQKP